MFKKRRLLAIQLGAFAAYCVIAYFSDWIPTTISYVLAAILLGAWFLSFITLKIVSGTDEYNRRHPSLSELIREARDQDSSPR